MYPAFTLKNNNMSRIPFFILLLFLFSSCGKDKKTGDVDMVFYLTYKGQPLVMFDTLIYPVTNQKFNFTRFAMYLSDVTFLKNDGAEDKKLEIDLLDLTNAHSALNASKGFTYTLKGLEEGDYNTFRFSVGVPAVLNAKAPKDFASSHILSSSANYWSSWKSYIFTRTEGNIDFDSNGSLENSFALHAGGDEAFITFTGEKKFTVREGTTAKIELEIDMEKYFNGKTLYDIQNNPSIHSLEHKPLITQLRDNLSMAVFLR
jgi:hypothetical protein